MTIKGGWEDRSDVSCPAYGFRCGIRERSGEEGYSSGDTVKQLASYMHRHGACVHVQQADRVGLVPGTLLTCRTTKRVARLRLGHLTRSGHPKMGARG